SERWDPASGTWTPAGSLASRSLHTAVRLSDGSVLLAAGVNALRLPTKTTARFDPAAGAWSAAASLATARVLHTMTVLGDGRVLVAGGLSGLAPLASAEV